MSALEASRAFFFLALHHSSLSNLAAVTSCDLSKREAGQAFKEEDERMSHYQDDTQWLLFLPYSAVMVQISSPHMEGRGCGQGRKMDVGFE